MRSEVSSEASIENPVIAKSVIFDAFCFGALLFAVGLGAVGLRFALNRVFAPSDEHRYVGALVFSGIIAIAWFFASLFFLSRFRSQPTGHSPDSDKNSRSGIVRTILSAICISSILSLCLWMAVFLNDEIFESRLLPWIPPLITFQRYGIGKASGLFPCHMEGSDLGCEDYKIVPTLLVANALLYFPFVMFGLLVHRKSARARYLIESGVTLMVRTGPFLVALGLTGLLMIHGFGLDTHDSLYPNPGTAHWHFGLWEVVDDLTGTIIVIAGVLVPFYTYRACRKSDDQAIAKIRTRDLTAIVTVLLMSLMLGSVY